MSFSTNELQEKIRSLQRAPPPKAPSKVRSGSLQRSLSEEKNGMSDIAQLIPGFQLKKTGFRESLIAEDVDNKHTSKRTDEPENELFKAIEKRRKQCEQHVPLEEEEIKEDKPKLKPKPLPRPSIKNKQRSLSSSSDESAKEKKENSTDENKNLVNGDAHGEPRLCILPTLESLGKPPSKPPKQGNLRMRLEKYTRADIVIARPRNSILNRSFANSIVVPEDNSNFEQEDYDDLDEIKDEVLEKVKAIPEVIQEQEDYDDLDEMKDKVLGKANGEEGIFEENYDDVDEIAEKVKEMNKNFDGPEESYDDLDTVAEQAKINDFSVGDGKKFGEEIYEAVGSKDEIEEEYTNCEDGFDPPIENKFSPSVTQPSSLGREKGKKDIKKEQELQKKREREEQKKKKEEEKKREKEEREEKKRKEEEKRKRERDDRELRKKHKLKPGIEGNGVAEAKVNFVGEGKFELPAKQGEALTILCEQGCPPGKWLVKNEDGHLGYVPTDFVQLKIDSQGNRLSAVITEDFYEDVDQYQNGGQKEEEGYVPELYDDIAGQDGGPDDIYEELPADQ
ncbi:DNA ligase 1-like [Montipora foliosa]|uniref:DNA ligase 1-like n=1 Tax=Montipora foliosa TaxID=591990 RepID=UPI0035F16975